MITIRCATCGAPLDEHADCPQCSPPTAAERAWVEWIAPRPQTRLGACVLAAYAITAADPTITQLDALRLAAQASAEREGPQDHRRRRAVAPSSPWCPLESGPATVRLAPERKVLS